MPLTAQDMVDIANAIRNGADINYQSAVPVATVGNISDVSNPLTQYTVYANTFITALLNRIGLTVVHNKALTNRLAGMKTGALPLGNDVQEIYTNPVEATNFNPAGDDLFTVVLPDTKVAYHRMNSQKRFDISISEQRLRQAFVSWDTLAKFVDSIMNGLYSGMFKYEYDTTKALISASFAKNTICKQSIAPITDEASAKAFIKKAREYYSLFQFPRNDCNAYSQFTGGSGITTWTNPEDIRLIITSQALAAIDVDVLAAAFNMDKTTLLGQIIEVDSFYDSDLVAVLCDKAFCQIWDVLEELRPFENGSNLTFKYYLHKWQVYSTSLFANAVAFHTGAMAEYAVTSAAGSATGDTNITVKGSEGTSVTTGLRYQLGAEAPVLVTYRQVVDTDDWSALTVGNMAAAVVGDNEYITVISINSDNEVVAAGYEHITVKEA